VAERRFTAHDQEAFAALSGDRNPIHLDPLRARRTVFGRVLVHGIHATLWGLEASLGPGDGTVVLRSLRVSFPSAIGIGDPVLMSQQPADDAVEVALEVRGSRAASIRYVSSPDRNPAGPVPLDAVPESGACRDTVPEELPARSGRLPLRLDRARAARLFPVLARRLEPIQFAQLLASTRLVGMECPGLRSVFLELAMDFSNPAAESMDAPGGEPAAGGPELTWRVARYVPALSLVSMDLQSHRMTGSIKAFVRPAPRLQPPARELAGSVRSGEFAGQRALVIGGSRGLGEVTAKLLAAGGASVVLTYRHGIAEAEEVVRDIAGCGGGSSCAPWDVLRPGEAPLPPGWSPTHLYYFATPHIATGLPGSFSADLFDTFRAYYVTGLLDSVAALAGRSADLRAVFCPSSVYVEAPPPNLAEYSAAKSEGEQAARRLAAEHPGWVVDAPRLPRLATDQTATMIRTASEEPAPVLLPHLRAFHARTRAS
jgi:hypothetical protein